MCLTNSCLPDVPGRGAVVREDELVACLQEGRILGAGLDVTTTEPPPPDSALWDLPNVWLSPHTGTYENALESTGCRISEWSLALVYMLSNFLTLRCRLATSGNAATTCGHDSG